MNIPPLSLVLLLSFISQQEIRAAQSGRGDDQRVHQQSPAYSPHHQSPPAWAPTLAIAIPQSPAGHRESLPPSSGYPLHNYGSYPLQTVLAPVGCRTSLPLDEKKPGHIRQRSRTFDLGDLSLGTDVDVMNGVKEIPVPRQLQDSCELSTIERGLLIAATQALIKKVENFLKKGEEEQQAIIERFNTINTGETSPGEKKHDSTFEKLAKGLRSANKNDEKSLAQKREYLLKVAEPFNKRFDKLGAQYIFVKEALEDATKKINDEARLK